MAVKTILTSEQAEILQLISQSPIIFNNFYLSGGTALAEFYLLHRLSEDLDFFCEKEFDPQDVFPFLRSIQKKIKIKKIVFEQSFNRNLFFLHLDKVVIKTEFTYYPFLRIQKGKLFNKLQIDSLLDIAVNKVFTIYQKPRARDFIDLYIILKKNDWKVSDLIKKSKVKFDWHVDPLQLGSQFLQAKVVKDYPYLVEKIKPQEWQDFFLKEAEKLKKDIFK